VTETYVAAGGQRIRVGIRPGTGVPLVLCNGIGASFEVLDPLVDRLDPDRTVIRFDVPGTGGSPDSALPYGFPYLAWVLGRVLTKLGVGVVDVLGLSWGGALAQQFAFQNLRRCRRLVLVATGTGVLMVPGHPRVLAKMLTRRRFRDPDYAASIAGRLYGGSVRARCDDVARIFCSSCMPAPVPDSCISSSPGPCGRACSRCPRSGNRPCSSQAPTTRSSRWPTRTSCPDYFRTPGCTGTRAGTSTWSPTQANSHR
jgi:pimeloyl-ACP methyl ester carboxylesterase